MRSLTFQSVGTRLPLILTTVFALVATFFIGAAIGQGAFLQIYMIFFGLAAIVVALAMGSKYWLLIPIAFSFSLPAIPFRGRAFELPELAIVLCTVLFACRYALNPFGVTFFRRSHASVILYTAWAALIFVLHPVGLSAMGSSLGGARFYAKIALALASFLIVVNQKVTERDAKWIVRLLLIGSLVSMTVNIIQFKVFGPLSPYANPNAYEEQYYTWHQAMALPAYWFTLWLVSRYKIREIFGFTKPWALILLMLCIAIAAVSGKRAGFASVILAPIIAALVRKESLHVFVGAMLAAFLIFILTIGHGVWFTLPLQAQRSLSYLPGRWDWEVKSQFQGNIDPFRKEMRELAWKNIERHPYIGQGYAVNIHELFGIQARGDLHMFTLLSLSLGSSWHNTWLGIWADFGLPAVLFWALFWFQAVRVNYWCYQHTTQGTTERTLIFMLFLSFIIAICRSWTSGHSADDAFSSWWMYGFLLAFQRHLTPVKRARAATPPHARPFQSREVVHQVDSP